MPETGWHGSAEGRPVWLACGLGIPAERMVTRHDSVAAATRVVAPAMSRTTACRLAEHGQASACPCRPLCATVMMGAWHSDRYQRRGIRRFERRIEACAYA